MYALFLGCIAPLRYPGIESSTKAILKELGVEFTDLEDASCCPAPGITRSFNQKTWLSIGARNLALAEKKNCDVLTICNGCFGSLFDIAHRLNNDEKLRNEVNKILSGFNLSYNGKVKVRHFADFLAKDIRYEKIKAKVKKNLNLKVAVHYGCHLLRPSRIKNIDEAEKPRILDDLVEIIGVKSIDYIGKMNCCGAGGGVRARTPDIALKMTKEKLDNIKKINADAIIDVCPFCHLQYDRGQKDIGNGYNIPVLHLSQLYAIAFGLPKEILGFEVHAVPINLFKEE